jgi:hypothetical protein
MWCVRARQICLRDHVPCVVAVTDVAVEAVGTKFIVVHAVFYVAFAGGVVVAAYDVVIDVAVDAFWSLS